MVTSINCSKSFSLNQLEIFCKLVEEIRVTAVCRTLVMHQAEIGSGLCQHVVVKQIVSTVLQPHSTSKPPPTGLYTGFSKGGFRFYVSLTGTGTERYCSKDFEV